MMVGDGLLAVLLRWAVRLLFHIDLSGDLLRMVEEIEEARRA